MLILYKCSYCSPWLNYINKDDCLAHEALCKHNPLNKGCYSCKNRFRDYSRRSVHLCRINLLPSDVNQVKLVQQCKGWVSV